MALDKDSLAKTAWFLDYDGSLCPHQEVWEERIYSTDEIYEVLKILASKTRGLFWNTGRRTHSLGGVDKRFLDYSGYFVHGSIFWDASAQQERILGPLLEGSFKGEIITHFSTFTKYRIEIKPTSARVVAVDLRDVDELKAYMVGLIKKTPPDWHWILGNRGAELLAKDFSKAVAVRTEMARAAKGTVPVALGDDTLDRPAVEAALAAGGYAVLIGDGCGWITEVPHKPKQVVFFETPARFHTWLRGL